MSDGSEQIGEGPLRARSGADDTRRREEPVVAIGRRGDWPVARIAVYGTAAAGGTITAAVFAKPFITKNRFATVSCPARMPPRLL